MPQTPNDLDPPVPVSSAQPGVEEPPIEDPDAEADATDETAEPVRYLITSYGADMPVDSLVDRFKRDDIFIPPFQRKFVWTRNQASRFVESLLLGLPVPGIFLFREPDTRKLMVVDGQQRIVTLSSFYGGVLDGRKFSLSKVSSEFQGKAYDDLDDGDRRMLNDAIVHATIFVQDEPTDDRGSVYSVFERLNTGGSALQPQEIRSCVYRGSLIDLLGELAKDDDWCSLWGRPSDRKKDEEVILRFLALHNDLDAYQPPLKIFLNDFTATHRHWNAATGPAFEEQFRDSVRVIAASLGRRAFRPVRAVNTAVADAVLCGVAHRLSLDGAPDSAAWVPAWERLKAGLETDDLVSGGTAHLDRVRRRILLAREAFAPV